MAQHDYSIANGTGSAVRSDLNNALAAIVSMNSGATEPTTTFAFQFWADTNAGQLKMRNSANDGWIELRQLDGEFSTVSVASGSAAAPSIFFNLSGTDTGIYSHSADSVDVSTTGTRRLDIGAGGDVTVRGGNVTLNAQGDLRLADSDSSNWVAFQAPATVASNVTWTLPSADGSNGQALTTNGSGTLSWTSAGGASITTGNTTAEVVDTGSDGHFKVTTEGTEALRITAAQRVGIGTGSPSFKTEIVDTLQADANLNYSLVVRGDDSGTVGESAQIYLSAINATTRGTAIAAVLKSGSNDHDLVFKTSAASATPTERLRITSDGTLQLRNSPGIDFSQIQSNASAMISETLDSYEEGRWTPRLNGYTGTAYANVTNTTTYEPGLYIKVGRSVTVFIHYQYTSMPIGQNRPWYIYDLPFAPSTQTVATGAIYFDNITNAYSLVVSKSAGYASPLFLQARTSNSATNSDLTYSGSSGFLTMSLTYWTDA